MKRGALGVRSHLACDRPLHCAGGTGQDCRDPPCPGAGVDVAGDARDVRRLGGVRRHQSTSRRRLLARRRDPRAELYPPRASRHPHPECGMHVDAGEAKAEAAGGHVTRTFHNLPARVYVDAASCWA